ncbi:PIR protein, partial [Plasmodium vivax]
MSCYNDSGEYFDCNCYNEFKRYYDKPYDSPAVKEFFEEKKYCAPENYKLIYDSSNKFIRELAKNISSDHHTYSNRAITCKYINYWLNEQIQKNYVYELTESGFEFFKSFADEFAKHKYSEKTYASNTCSKYFSLLDNVKYRRMQGLYDMYRLYDEIINPRKYNKKVNICSNLMAINNAYKNLAWEFKGDDELNKKLESFKNSDLKKAKGHDDTCGNNVLSNIEQVKLTYSPPKQSSVLQEENIERQVQSETANSRGLQKTVVLRNHTHETEASNEETLSELTQKTTEQPHQGEVRFPDVEPPEKEVAPAEVTQEQLYRSGFQENILPERQLYKSALLTQPRSLPFGTIYNEQYAENQGSPSDGIFNKMSGALSGFMSNVDPIPVVGVSGGMGALFLLFR